MKIKQLAAIGMVFAWAGVAHAADPRWVPITSSEPAPPALKVLTDSGDRIVVQMDLPGYFTEDVPVDGESCTLVTLPRSPSFDVLGDPALPCVRANLAVPGTARMVLGEVRAVVRETVVGLYLPSKGPLYRNQDPSSIPYVFGSAYETDSGYPAQSVLLGDPFILRNVRGLPIQFNPFVLNPAQGTLEIRERMTAEILSAGSDVRNVLTSAQKVKESREFLEVYARRFLNSPKEQEYTHVGEAGRLLIITYDAFYDAMLPFYYWKLQKGIPTSMVTVTAAGGTAANIKNYILSQYQSPQGLTYVLLVGDYQQVPFMAGTAGNVAGNPSDPSYGLLAGSDNYFEVFVSRFSAQNTTDVQVQVNKILNYEKTPQSGGAWYHKAFGIAGDDEGGSPSYADWERAEFLRAVLQTPAYVYTDFDQIYHSSATAAQVSAAVNAGRGLGLYIDHGSETAWVTTGFNVSNVNALTNNTGMLPFIISVACVNGSFNYSGGDCFAEAWLKAGTPAAPKGAVAFYGSSTNQSWVPPCVGQREAVDLLASETYHTIGALYMNGCMKAVDDYPGTGSESGAELCQSWHIFGDASMMVYTNTPSAMSVVHSGTLVIGVDSYDVSVPGVSGALCALYDEASHTLYGSAYTDASGSAAISMASPPGQPGTLRLTVTAMNRIPYFGEVLVGSSTVPSLAHYAHAISDACAGGGSGSGDGIVDPGENVSVRVTLKNQGAAATGVRAGLSTTAAGVSVTSSSATFPDIGSGSTAESLAPHFELTVDPSVPCGTVIALQLAIAANEGAWTSSLSLTVGSVSPPSPQTPLSQDFNSVTVPSLPAGWCTEVVTGTAWKTSATACSTGQTLTYPGASSAADSWVYSSGMPLKAGATCTLHFTERVPNGLAQNLSAWAGSSAGHAAMTIPIWSQSGLSNSTCADKTGTFSVPSDGTYFLGFHCTSPAMHLTLVADDVSVTYEDPGSCTARACAATPPETAPGGTPGTAQTWSGIASQQWPSNPQATGYKVYRGVPADLPKLLDASADSCLKWSGSGTSCAVTDDPSSVTGRFYWYLVTATNASGEGAAGNATAGARILNSSGGCP